MEGCREAVDFFDRQLKSWPLAQQNVAALREVKVKVLETELVALAVQFNPARIVSTGARIDKKTIAERPCFLCSTNRPAVQESLPLLDGRYELLVNPFPILPLHFTLPSTVHEPQRIRQTYIDMMHMAEQLTGLFLFYNGPRCGASAPDHLHFQAGRRAVVPLERDFNRFYRPQSTTDGIYVLSNYCVEAWCIVAGSAEESERLFLSLYDRLPMDVESGEPMMNLLAWFEEADKQWVSIVIPRTKHRPACYTADGDAQCLVSPGALDMAGLIITPRKEDYDRMTADKAVGILQEVGKAKSDK